MEGIVPRQHGVFQKGDYPGDSDHVLARMNMPPSITLYKPLCLSLPNNGAVNALLTSLSTRSASRCLITRVIQCPPDPPWAGSSSSITSLCTFAKPLVGNKGAYSVSEEWSDDGIIDSQARVNDGNGMELLFVGCSLTSLSVCPSTITMFYIISTGIHLKQSGL